MTKITKGPMIKILEQLSHISVQMMTLLHLFGQLGNAIVLLIQMLDGLSTQLLYITIFSRESISTHTRLEIITV